MKKDYQTETAAVATAVETVMPDAVSVTLAELAGSLRGGPVGAGGRRWVPGDGRDHGRERHCVGRARRAATTRNRSAVRHGSEDGSVTLGGRRVPVRRPRVRTADRTAEVAVPAYELFSSTECCRRWRWSG